MSRLFIFAFGVAAYVVFFLTFLYLVAFVGNLGVPVSVDTGPEANMAMAAVINVGLIALFGVQHSVMARPGFKKVWTQIVPHAAERSVYVLLASVMLIIMFYFWRPMPDVVWSVEATGARTALWALFGVGWGIVLLSTFLINHFELFGLRQVWANLIQKPIPAQQFRQPMLYKAVRHPLYLGFVIAFWATPDMSVGHLLLAAVFTAHILIAIQLEERDLLDQLGDAYAEYRRRVGMLIPGFGKVR